MGNFLHKDTQSFLTEKHESFKPKYDLFNIEKHKNLLRKDCRLRKQLRSIFKDLNNGYISFSDDKMATIYEFESHYEDLRDENGICQEMKMMAEQMNKIQYFPIPLIYTDSILSGFEEDQPERKCYLKFNLLKKPNHDQQLNEEFLMMRYLF